MTKDATTTRRQSKRRERLNGIAQASGFKSWSEFETATINGKVKLEDKMSKYDDLMTHVNIDERYGAQVPVTIRDYQELNPEGIFSVKVGGIFEEVDGKLVKIAEPRKE
jgi:hypothetical protein